MLTATEQARLHPEFSRETLHVITPVCNPKRYASRYRLYAEFERYCGRFSNVVLHPVEMAFGERDFVIDHPNVVRVRGHDELWHKENLINIAATRLPADWRYMAWIDADITFAREDWAMETLHLLQHYAVVQMFSHAIDLGPNHEPFGGFRESFGLRASGGGPLTMGYGGNGQPGYAWAIRREAFDAVGGLIDTAVVGAADHHMALAMFGRADLSLPTSVSSAYAEPVMLWQERALRVIQRNVGCMPGTVLHYWHGKKADRRYEERWAIVCDHDFDPRRDIVRDSQGLFQLTGAKPGLRDDLRRYFANRNEDSVDR